MSAETQPQNATNEKALPRRREQETAATARAIQSRRVPFACDIYENDDEYFVVADLPGVDPDRLEAVVHGDRLSVRGTRFVTETEIVHERIFTLPQNADVNAVDATIQDGVLRIRIPKTQESKPRRIAVRGG
jgi:HSP20 family molecular chaperone IbpA